MYYHFKSGNDTSAGERFSSWLCWFNISFQEPSQIIGYPHGYLSPGQYDVAIQFDAEDFGIHSTRAVPLQQIKQEFGGYSGGFKDGPWACFNPFRSFYGPVGGVRSNLEVDKHHLRSYENGVVVCIHDSVWWMSMKCKLVLLLFLIHSAMSSALYGTVIRSFDLGDVQPDLRGFSEALRGIPSFLLQ